LRGSPQAAVRRLTHVRPGLEADMDSAVCRRPARGAVVAALATALVAHASAQVNRRQPSNVSAPDLVEAEIDGKPLTNRQDLQTLLRASSVRSVSQQLKERNASFNISRVERNFNEPTFALQVLERKNVFRFQFTRNAVTNAGDVALVTLRFDERDGPTLVVALTDRHAICCSGEFAIDAGTGQVRHAVVRFKDTRLSGELVTTYALDPALALWVPSRFTEKWNAASETVTGDAKYSGWRRFEVTSRIK
jgi:hypothetical protein